MTPLADFDAGMQKIFGFLPLGALRFWVLAAVCDGVVSTGVVAILHGRAAVAADELSAGDSPAVVPPVALGATDQIGCVPTRRGNDLVIVIAPFGDRADLNTFGPPPAAVPLAGGENMSDLVQDGVAHLFFGIQECEQAGQRDELSLLLAASEPAPGMIKPKRPAGQTVLGHQFLYEVSGEVEIHCAPDVEDPLPENHYQASLRLARQKSTVVEMGRNKNEDAAPVRHPIFR